MKRKQEPWREAYEAMSLFDHACEGNMAMAHDLLKWSTATRAEYLARVGAFVQGYLVARAKYATKPPPSSLAGTRRRRKSK